MTSVRPAPAPRAGRTHPIHQEVPVTSMITLTRPAPPTCTRCPLAVHARTLCLAHYQSARRRGALDDYPRTLAPRAQVIEEWNSLRAMGFGPAQIRRALGLSSRALRGHLGSARRSGIEVAA